MTTPTPHPADGRRKLPEPVATPEFCRFLRAALLSLEVGDLDMARRIGFHVDRLDTRQPHGRLVCAMVDLRRGQCEEACEKLALLQREFPGHPVVRVILSSANGCPLSPAVWPFTGCLEEPGPRGGVLSEGFPVRH